MNAGVIELLAGRLMLRNVAISTGYGRNIVTLLLGNGSMALRASRGDRGEALVEGEQLWEESMVLKFLERRGSLLCSW